jgi:hypothetical protein
MEVKKFNDLVPVKVTKICSNDEWPLLYLPKEAIEALNLRKGKKVVIFLNPGDGSLIIKPVEKLALPIQSP